MTTFGRRRTAPSSLDTLKPVFGWWGLDPEGPTLVNKASGQRIRYVGPTNLSGEGMWHRFEYQDDDVRYPILAQLRTQDLFRHLRWRQQNRRVFYVDHDMSAVCWQREYGGATEYPDYGLWRRVDDCITDGLVCWTRLPPDGEDPDGVVVQGGWLNSAWSRPEDRFTRSQTRLTDVDRTREAEGRVVADRPFVMPLDTPLPSPWIFREAETDYQEPYPYPPRPKRPPTYFGLVPHDMPSSETTAFMISEDGQRILLTRGGGGGGGSHRGREVFHFQYADPDVKANFSGFNVSDEWPSNWHFDFLLGRGEIRETNPQNQLYYVPDEHRKAPSFALWRRLSWAVVDGWLFFEGWSVQRENWQTTIRLAAARFIEFYPLYVGGIWRVSGRCIAGTGLYD